MSLFGRAKPEGSRFRLGEREIRCLYCTHDRFARGEGQLNTAGMSFLGLDWLNQRADVVICAECSHIMWFAKELQRLDD